VCNRKTYMASTSARAVARGERPIASAYPLAGRRAVGGRPRGHRGTIGFTEVR
jgi:hypothetical protein